jgi:UDP-glucuronate 4-epimerase
MKIFLTGSAGFIGFHLASRLLDEGHEVLGFDGLTPYYDVRLKRQRLALLSELPRFSFIEGLLQDRAGLAHAMRDFGPDIVVHLAAQAGVRDTSPDEYLSSNVMGTTNVLEGLRSHRPRHFLHASTSSIYGANLDMPFVETSRTDFPVSLYAATKKACEAITHTYSHLYRLPITCFRFFTVYGPWGRPDMALFRFAEAISEGRPIDVYGSGLMKRDFTYIDDLIEAVRRLIDTVPSSGSPAKVNGVKDSLSPVAPWRTVNIAQGQPVDLLRFIEVIEASLGKRAVKKMLPMQQGDVEATWASPALLRALIDFVPETSVEVGVRRFVEWYQEWRTSRPS